MIAVIRYKLTGNELGIIADVHLRRFPFGFIKGGMKANFAPRTYPGRTEGIGFVVIAQPFIAESSELKIGCASSVCLQQTAHAYAVSICGMAFSLTHF